MPKEILILFQPVFTGHRRTGWSRKWQPTPVFLPGKFYGQRNLAGYIPWHCKESDTTEPACAKADMSGFLSFLTICPRVRLLDYMAALFQIF